MERSQPSGAGEQNERTRRKLGDDKEPKQDSEKEAGGGDLLPEMDRAELLRAWPGIGVSLLWTRDRGRTGMQKPEKTAKRAGISMVVRVRGQKQECEGDEQERGCTALSSDASAFHFV